MRRSTMWLCGLLAVLVAVGGGMIWASTQVSASDEPAPMPSSTFNVSVDPTPHGPTEAPIELVDAVPPSASTELEAESSPASVIMTPAKMAASHVFVPSLGAYAPIAAADIAAGRLAIPDDAHKIGLWSGGAALGDDTGTVLMAGHVAWRGVRGSLRNLAHIDANAAIYTKNADGDLQAWQVTSIRAESRFDVHDDLFTRDGEHVLVLVTCGGRVIDGHFEHNVIVTAKPQP